MKIVSPRVGLAALSAVLSFAGVTVVLASSDASVGPDPIANVLYAQKLATRQQLDDAAAQARQGTQPAKDPNRGGGAPIATPEPWPTGVFEAIQAPLSTAEYQITNQWQGVVGPNYVQIYAGSMTADPSDGVLYMIVTARDNLSKVSGKAIHAPGRPGALGIAAANGTKLALTAPGGRTFAFDAAVGAFGR